MYLHGLSFPTGFLSPLTVVNLRRRGKNKEFILYYYIFSPSPSFPLARACVVFYSYLCPCRFYCSAFNPVANFGIGFAVPPPPNIRE